MKKVLSAMLPGAKVGATLTTLPSGRMLKYPLNPFDLDPERIEELPSSVRGVIESIRAIADLDRQIVELGKDARLTPVGVAEKLREPRASTLKKFGYAYEAHVLAHAKSTDEMEAQLYALPAFSTENYARERHILDLLLAAPKEKAEAIYAHALSGEDDELAVALIRAPKVFDALFDGRISGKSMRQLGIDAWRAAIDKRNPEAAATLRMARELNAWATDTFARFAGEFRNGGSADLLGPELRANPRQVIELAGAAAQFF